MDGLRLKKGLLSLSAQSAIDQAIEVNGVSVRMILSGRE